jgi:hypothetical protein
VLRHAQYLGDLRALREHGRRVVRIHLGGDVEAGMARLSAFLSRALGAPPAGDGRSPKGQPRPTAKVGE